MQRYAFAPIGYDEEANLDILMFVPDDAPEWSTDQEGSGHLCIERATGNHYAYLPFGTTELPTFTEEDIEGMKLAQADIISGEAFGMVM